MRLLRYLRETIFLFFERLKGATSVIEVATRGDILGTLTGYSISGHEITIYCRKKLYLRHYSIWFAQAKTSVTYHVYAIVSPNAPQALRDVCELEVTFSPFLPNFISEQLQKDTAIDAYLDLLVQRLESDFRFNA